jgi:hypothetical protein
MVRPYAGTGFLVRIRARGANSDARRNCELEPPGTAGALLSRPCILCCEQREPVTAKNAPAQAVRLSEQLNPEAT